jgi:hypothetical protein
MFSGDPKNISDFIALVMMVLLAMWGGTVNYIGRISKGAATFSLLGLVCELSISGFVGVLIILIGLHYQIDVLMIGVLAGVGGHAGGRTMFYLERFVTSKKVLLVTDDSEGKKQ